VGFSPATTKDLSIFSFSFQLFIKAKIIKPTQLSGFLFGGPLGPYFELF
tara:strand:+ start:147 stop:293 length:147 start_codon:yes stop_codon:yes gene_type:complete